MIKSRTPYYIYVPFVSPATGATASQYTINLTIWEGALTSKPTETSYMITNSNISGSVGNDRVNIARLVKDFIDVTPISGGVVWVNYNITYITDNEVDAMLKQLNTYEYATRGYGYGLDGENPQINTSILLKEKEYKVSNDGCFNVPVIADLLPLPEYNGGDYESADYNT